MNTWNYEERKMKKALAAAKGLEDAYPNNVINLQVLGRVQMYNKQYKASERTFNKVLKLSPKNQRVHYYLARLHMRQQQYDKAEKEINKYLKFDLSEYHEGYAYYYKGHILMKRKNYTGAAKAYDNAWKVNKIEKAKKRAEIARQKAKKK